MTEGFEFKFDSHWFKSPGYLTLSVPNIVKEELLSTISEVESGKVDVQDYRDKLAGHQSVGDELPVTPNIKYLTESLCVEYERIFLNGERYNKEKYTPEEMNQNHFYQLKTLWINYSKKHEFNPMHTHSGDFSFVIWVKIPFDLEKELSMFKSNGSAASLFSFTYVDAFGKITPLTIHIDKNWEWRMAFFPAKLPHSVNPFYTSDEERISISGNIFCRPMEVN